MKRIPNAVWDDPPLGEPLPQNRQAELDTIKTAADLAERGADRRTAPTTIVVNGEYVTTVVKDRRAYAERRSLSEFQETLDNALQRVRFDSLQQASHELSGWALTQGRNGQTHELLEQGIAALQHFSEDELVGLFHIVRRAMTTRAIESHSNGRANGDT